MIDLIGQIIGGCRIDALLGKGGMGYVFLAHHINLDKPVAVKILNMSIENSSLLVDRFFLEARAAAKLDSNHIIRILQVAKEQNLYYLQMEYIEGESLESYLKRNAPLDIPTALHFLLQIAKGLSHAHDANLIHRDIKPDNVMINAKGILKLTDFGLVKLLESDHQLTATGNVLGTPYYVCPELCEGKTIDVRSDIYSLGIAMYYMLTGEMPFKGDSSLVIVVSRLHNEPEPLITYRSDLPIEINDFVLKMIARNPDERPKDAHELTKKIEELLAIFAKNYTYNISDLDIHIHQATVPKNINALGQNNQLNISQKNTLEMQNSKISEAHTMISSKSDILGSEQTLNASYFEQTNEPETMIHMPKTSLQIDPDNHLEQNNDCTDSKNFNESKTITHMPNTIAQTIPNNHLEQKNIGVAPVNIKNKEKRSSIWPSFIEIAIVLLLVFGIFGNIHNKHRVYYSAFKKNKATIIYGKYILYIDYARAVTTAVDTSPEISLPTLTSFVKRYPYSVYTDQIKSLLRKTERRKTILDKFEQEISLSPQIKSHFKREQVDQWGKIANEYARRIQILGQSVQLEIEKIGFFATTREDIINILKKNDREWNDFIQRKISRKDILQEIFRDLDIIFEKSKNDIRKASTIEFLDNAIKSFYLEAEKIAQKISKNLPSQRAKEKLIEKVHNYRVLLEKEFTSKKDKLRQEQQKIKQKQREEARRIHEGILRKRRLEICKKALEKSKKLPFFLRVGHIGQFIKRLEKAVQSKNDAELKKLMQSSIWQKRFKNRKK